MKRWLLAVVVSLLVVGAVSSVQAVGCDANAGTSLTDGCLYTITGGDTADPTDGFPVQNVDGINWWTCVQTLELQDVGYPIAQPFEFDGFQVLALQKVMLQYRPDLAAGGGACSPFAYLNTMDLLANTYGVNLGGVPAHAVWPQDAGASWAQIVANHLALLDQNPVIKAKFLEKPNWLQLYGLPIAYESQTIDGNPEGAQVLRAQRAVWRIFNVPAPGTTQGVPHLLNVPDMIKQLDGVIIPTSAKMPAAATPGRIVFASDRSDDGGFDIYVMDDTGANVQQLTTAQWDVTGAWDYDPAWSPDGTRIAFRRTDTDGDRRDIYVMDADGGNVQNLTDDSGWDQHPAWSPDGTRIAFASYRDGDSDVYIMDTDGGNVQQLTTLKTRDSEPAWSPDGTRIAFARGSFHPKIHVMDADGGNVQQLTENPKAQNAAYLTLTTDRSPAWSPDGTRIAFASNRDGISGIYVMNADGENLQKLTDDSKWGQHPVWSPDGTRIVFESDRDGPAAIYVMNADGTNVQKLTYDLSWNRRPSWRPGTVTLPPAPAPAPAPAPTPPPAPTTGPWTGIYYDNNDLTNPVLTRTDTAIDFDWDYGSPDAAVHPDTFSVRWAGAPIFTAGTYQFTAGADDGIRLYIDGALAIDQWHLTAYTEYTATRVLTAGAHDITVEYFESLGAAKVKLAWAEVPANTSAGRIAFTSLRNSVSDLYSMSANGANVQQLTATGANFDPAWSPDGTRIVFASDRDGARDLYVMDADGANVQQLTDAPGFDRQPSWSPDGTRIVFTGSRSGNFDLYVMDADGGNVQQLNDDPGSDLEPAWSPDGTQIVFASDRDGDSEIYLMGVGGQQTQEHQRLTDKPGDDTWPAWSPDGTQIAFMSNRDGDYDIYVMDADGTNVQQLTDDPARDGYPVWSPDGSRLAFTSLRNGDYDLYVMAADGTNVQQLTDTLEWEWEPAWSPA